MNQETVDKLSMLILYNKSMLEYYRLITEYELENEKKKCNYTDIGNKMKEIIAKEDKIYNNLNVKELNEMLGFVFHGIGSPNERQRMIGHLADALQKKLMSNITFISDDSSVNEGNYLSMLDSKIDIDSLTQIDMMLETTDGIDNDSYKELRKYWTLSKFIRLSRNSYIEKLAIEKDFDVYRIETITFDKIKENLSEEAISSIEQKYIMAIQGELESLSTLDKVNVNPLVRTYTAMTALVNIEIRLDFLGIEALTRLKTYYIDKYNNCKNEQMEYAKEIIRKKEEELNH